MPSKKENKEEENQLPPPKFCILSLPFGKTSKIRIYFSLPDEIKMDDNTFSEIWKMMPDSPSSVTCFGKKCFPKRRFKSFGLNYKFSNEDHEADPIENDYLKKILTWVQKHSGKDYNQMLINWYPDGSAGICAHSDDETQLVKDSSIYSFSFGQERDFVITDKRKTGVNPCVRYIIPMKNNSLLIMDGDTQSHYFHEVPVRSIKKCPEKRINITLRLFKEDSGKK